MDSNHHINEWPRKQSKNKEYDLKQNTYWRIQNNYARHSFRGTYLSKPFTTRNLLVFTTYHECFGLLGALIIVAPHGSSSSHTQKVFLHGLQAHSWGDNEVGSHRSSCVSSKSSAGVPMPMLIDDMKKHLPSITKWCMEDMLEKKMEFISKQPLDIMSSHSCFSSM